MSPIRPKPRSRPPRPPGPRGGPADARPAWEEVRLKTAAAMRPLPLEAASLRGVQEQQLEACECCEDETLALKHLAVELEERAADHGLQTGCRPPAAPHAGSLQQHSSVELSATWGLTSREEV
ncbi:hypothetical protein EYF80_050725 [Liparis tanakae]|uniref:Uncharacterized protein n=1 Tax=Liparis tanakae TaxID=230148 RepID=A0A4Z2FDW0_9TELE|nr:hypothetical protein EYF80_050725 [Liparis tanakae]